MRFQEHFKEYRVVVFGGLNCEDIYFDGLVDLEKKIKLVYDDVNRHYHVINNLRGAMARGYVCRGCNKRCRRGVTHKCGETCCDCKSVPLCFPKKESRASPVTQILEVARVSKNIRQTSSEVIRLSAKRCEIAPCVKRA